MSLGIRMESINSAGAASSETLTCRVAGIARMGQEDTQSTYNYTTGQTVGKLLKIGPGNLKRIIIGGIATSSALTIYDGTSTGGSVIWASGAMPNNTNPFSIDFDGCPFFTGLFLVIATANCNVTIIYE